LSRHQRPAMRFAIPPTTSSAPRRPSRSGLWDCGTTIFRRRRTKRSMTCSTVHEGAPMPHSNPQDLRELPYGDDRLERTVLIQTDHVTLEGTLGVPADANGMVLFAHGSGSSRFSPRNRFVARVLREAGLGTLLLDLLSHSEEEVDELTRHHRFDIPMLADRLVVA